LDASKKGGYLQKGRSSNIGNGKGDRGKILREGAKQGKGGRKA